MFLLDADNNFLKVINLYDCVRLVTIHRYNVLNINVLYSC